MAIEGGQITGTKDKDYNLIWFVDKCLDNALRLETYVQDAERAGDRDWPSSSDGRKARVVRGQIKRSSCFGDDSVVDLMAKDMTTPPGPDTPPSPPDPTPPGPDNPPYPPEPGPGAPPFPRTKSTSVARKATHSSRSLEVPLAPSPRPGRQDEVGRSQCRPR